MAPVVQSCCLIWCLVVQSRDVHPCVMVPSRQVSRFQSPLHEARRVRENYTLYTSDTVFCFTSGGGIAIDESERASTMCVWSGDLAVTTCCRRGST